ncbi:MAG: MMPL family transporter [Marinilabiliaceae bacterium]|nr:MMPL family transporter [Marinilabiliaceae bacterium]
MYKLFIRIFDTFGQSRKRLLIVLTIIVAAIVYFVTKIETEEDIASLIPMDNRISQLSDNLSNSKFVDQIIFNVSLKDTQLINDDYLVDVIDSLSAFLLADTFLVKDVRNSVDEKSYMSVYDFFYKYLPFYLTNDDYVYLDSILIEENLNNLMRNNYKSIIAPTGMGTTRYILRDPLSLVPRVLKRLESFQLDKNFTIYHSHIFTKDRKHALCFVDPVFSSKNTKENRKLIKAIDNYIKTKVPNDVNVEYYGGTAVAVANAKRVQNDIYLTIAIAIGLLILFFVFIFKSLKVLFILFTPVVLGVGVALSFLSVYYTTLSVISLGVGAILIGISIDYSLHYFSHVRYGHQPKSILKDISDPVFMSSLTTAGAFFCLTVVNSHALNQLGLFAGISVLAVSVFVLVCLPLLLSHKAGNDKNRINGLYDWLARIDLHKRKYLVFGVVILSFVFYFIGQSVRFDADIANLNYVTDKLQTAENNLKSISSEASGAIFVVSSDTSFDSSLKTLEYYQLAFDSLVQKGIINDQSNPTNLLLSLQKQKNQLNRWHQFWNKTGKEETIRCLSEAGSKFKFKDNAFSGFSKMINADYDFISESDYQPIVNLFLSNQVNVRNDRVDLITICKVTQENKESFFNEVAAMSGLVVLDRQFFTNQFFSVLKEDFSKLITVSMIIVFLIVLIFWGRFELAMITFIPIVLSWYWTIGLMRIFDLHFNIFNIIISTFIFGLGIDYSIFLMQGLINNYKYGKRTIIPYKVSILLSITTTLIGVGVLIFAKHPALKSIAAVTILGLVSVIIIVFTVIPFLFNWLVAQKGKKRISPITIADIFVSISSFMVFLGGVVFVSVIVLIFKIIPFFTDAKKRFVHYLVFINCNIVVRFNFLFRRDFIDKHKFDLSKPSVIICNHQSHLDLVLLLMQSPKIVVLTNEWVWKNPFYGLIIRYIDFFPIYTGIEKGYEKIKGKVEKGYSVLVFPEGTRTIDGGIKRFHQGAFSLADYLKLDIIPVLLHGAYDCMPKTEFFLRPGYITLKCFDRIDVDPVKINDVITYRQQARRMTVFYREQLDILDVQKRNVDYYKQRLISQFIYKGPVLEWYLRIKIRLEKYYRFYDDLLPRNGKIIDVGCGYGFMSFMMNYTVPGRTIIGWDYDSEKISVAQEIASSLSGISFEQRDVVKDSFEPADVFVFNDVLHYFPKKIQWQVLDKAVGVLNENGSIILRDADTELKKRTRFTKLTELLSIKILGFNKMKYGVEYQSSRDIELFAKEKGLSFTKVDNARFTSNVTYILSNKKDF